MLGGDMFYVLVNGLGITILRQCGYSEWAALAVLSCTPLSGMLAGPLFGRIGDSQGGRRRSIICIVSVVTTGIACTAFASSPLLASRSHVAAMCASAFALVVKGAALVTFQATFQAMTDATTPKEDKDLNQSFAQFWNTAGRILVYTLIITFPSIVGVSSLVLFASCALAGAGMTLISVAASGEICLTTTHEHEVPVESVCTSVQKLGQLMKDLVLRTERFSSNAHNLFGLTFLSTLAQFSTLPFFGVYVATVHFEGRVGIDATEENKDDYNEGMQVAGCAIMAQMVLNAALCLVLPSAVARFGYRCVFNLDWVHLSARSWGPFLQQTVWVQMHFRYQFRWELLSYMACQLVSSARCHSCSSHKYCQQIKWVKVLVL